MPPPRSIQDQFWSRLTVDDETGCWLWPGATDRKGYAQLTIANRRVRGARLAWELTNGPIPPGRQVRHRCDNPPCCNPSHLLVGSARENSADMVERGRSLKGERQPNARLTADAVRTIRASSDLGYELALRYGVSAVTISNIRRRRTWAWLD